MSSAGAVRGRPFTDAGEGLLHIALPPGTPEEAQTAVRRLIELTAILARRCAQLQEALETRVVIEQAKGVLAERFGLEPDRAFDVLRRGARSNRIPLRTLAEQVLSARQTPWEVAAQLDGAPLPPKLARSGR
jgi:hypothetical protein